MSRMLEALKQIESSAPLPVEEPAIESIASPPAEKPVVESVVPPPSDRIVAAVPDPEMETKPADAEQQAVLRLVSSDAKLGPSYAALAEHILSEFPPGCGAALMFTSPGDGEGKTGVLAPLAAAIAERATDDVLLVDANLRRPGLAEMLGIRPQYGLVDVLLGAANWRRAVRHTDMPRLSLLPGVNSALAGAMLPRHLSLGPLLGELDKQYGMILVDTASLAHMEVAPIAQYCTGTYLVVRLRQTIRRAAREAAEIIRNCGGRLLGVVAIES